MALTLQRSLADEKRRERWRLHTFLRETSPRVSARTCMMTSHGESVRVGVTSDAVAHVSGVIRCGSLATCQLCGPVIRERRAGQIDRVAAAAASEGYLVYFVTATVAHGAADGLGATMETIAKAWRHSFGGKIGQRGYVGQMRAWDYTYSEANGWHPHIHALVVLDPAELVRVGRRRGHLPGEAREDGRRFLVALGTKYRDRVRKLGGTAKRAAWDVRTVQVRADGGGDVASYLCKVEGGWGAGLELARSDVKSARSGHVTPSQVLSAAADGETWALRAWREFERAVYGRRQIIVGRKLCKMFAADAGEDDSTALAEQLRLTAASEVYGEDFSASEWCRYVRHGTVPQLLEAVRDRAVLLGFCCRGPDDS